MRAPTLRTAATPETGVAAPSRALTDFEMTRDSVFDSGDRKEARADFEGSIDLTVEGCSSALISYDIPFIDRTPHHPHRNA